MSTSCLVAATGLCLRGAGFSGTSFSEDGGASGTEAPIEHLVVIFQENVSFDRYFATYPVALNPAGEPFFRGSDDTPSVNGLGTLTSGNPEGDDKHLISGQRQLILDPATGQPSGKYQ